MMGHREPTKTIPELDCVSRWWRYHLCYLNNSSAAHKIKKQMTSRNRRTANREL